MFFDLTILTVLLVMNPETYEQWCDTVAQEPYSAKVLMREMFSHAYRFCDCRGNGSLVSATKLNNCLICCKRVCILDAHLNLDKFELALCAWIASAWKGKNRKNEL